jgi:hypothetical protein
VSYQPTKAISYPSEEKLVHYGNQRPTCGQPTSMRLHLTDLETGDTVIDSEWFAQPATAKSAAKVIGRAWTQ